MSKLYQAGIVTLIIGVILLGSSFAWPHVLPKKTLWDESQAIALQEAATTLHGNSFDSSISADDLETSRLVFESQKRQLDRAVATREHVPWYLRLFGLVVATIGIGCLLVDKNQSS